MATDIWSKAMEVFALEMDRQIFQELDEDTEIVSIEKILLQETGAYVEVLGEGGVVLRAFKLRDSWAVQLVEQYMPVDIEFDNAHDAAKSFVEIRHENRIGFDE